MLPLGNSLHCIAPAATMVDNFSCKQKKNNITQLLSSKPMVDLSKKAKKIQDPKQTLYSRHQCNKLRTNVEHHNLSWRAQLHFDFELSNKVNKQKFEKILSLNDAQKNLWAIYGPTVVKLLMAWYIASAIEILHHINTGGCHHAKDQCLPRSLGWEGRWVPQEVP